MIKNILNKVSKMLYITVFFSLFSVSFVTAETVSGNGYTLEQNLTPTNNVLSGNGYSVTGGGQSLGGLFNLSGFSIISGSGYSTTSTSTPPVTTTPTTPSTQTQSTGSNGGGYYILPPEVTGIYPVTATSSDSVTSTTTPPQTKPPTTKPQKPSKDDSIITDNGSTCPSRVVFSAPIDTTIKNNAEDVKKLERFLNEYEGEKLPVNGIYEQRDVEAVKRWQLKYRSYVLTPMRLRQPTGTIYTLSMRQIERQTTAQCGEPVLVTACPFFKENVKYGSRGAEVKKVQQFLNIVQGEKLPLSGVFGPLTKAAVKRFQKSRRIYVFTFIPIHIVTGNWYTTTRIKANETIGCDKDKLR